MALRGGAVNAITRWLSTEGAPLPGERTSSSTAWNRQTVDGLLRNPILAGMRPYNPGRGRKGTSVDPFAVVRDEAGTPVIDESLAIITVEEFTQLQHMLESRTVPQARKRSERRTTPPFLSRVARCDDCDVYLCRGTNQGKPILSCPLCRQTVSRTTLDPYLGDRLITERGNEPLGGSTVQDRWQAVRSDELARREVLLTQLDSLRIRRGVVGRYFDEARVILQWRPTAVRL